MSMSTPTQGIILTLLLHTTLLTLHALLPATVTPGYVCNDKTGLPLSYRLNGFRTLIVMILMFVVLYNTYPSICAIAIDEFRSVVGTSCVLGVICTVSVLCRSKYYGLVEDYARCRTTDQKEPQNPKNNDTLKSFPPTPRLQSYFLGFEFNSRFTFLGSVVDVKMYLYLIGACILQWVLLSGLSYPTLQSTPLQPSLALCTYVASLSYFLLEYMNFEQPHLYTYDLFCEKTGGKLIWGCVFFYPCFYECGLWGLLDFSGSGGDGGDISVVNCVCIATLFLTGNILTRGANMQKYTFKTAPTQTKFLGVIEQRTIKGTRLLCSGFWGLSRHVNYFGEILQAVALSLPCILLPLTQGSTGTLFYKVLAAMYPVYYVILFVTRERDDNIQCRAKYGEKWMEYEREVPWRIVPFFY